MRIVHPSLPPVLADDIADALAARRLAREPEPWPLAVRWLVDGRPRVEIVIDEPAHAVPMAEALLEGGIGVLKS